MLSSGYAILYRKGKRYVYRAIFFLNKLWIRQKVLDPSGSGSDSGSGSTTLLRKHSYLYGLLGTDFYPKYDTMQTARN
jgi:hypothetical protein